MLGGVAQDDARENRLIDLFNLSQAPNRVRHGVDAILKLDGETYEFELKSVTTSKGGISTVRDLGRDHIRKWENKHWIMAFFEKNVIKYCQYGSPDAMRPWIEEKWAYIEPDFEMAKHIPSHVTLETMYTLLGKKDVYSKADAKKLHKNQMSSAEYDSHSDCAGGYTPDRMLQILQDRARYLIERGSTLNNPHIPARFIASWPVIAENHASRLRELVREWRAS